MLIKLKNKDTLQFDNFVFKCTIGKKGISSKKKEGDLCTPKGTFSIKNLYYRSDRLLKPQTKIIIKKIKKNMGWCNDPKSNKYNSLVTVKEKIRYEKMYRKDHKYDIVVVIGYNLKKPIPYKGSAIFIHLTNNYKPTAGCIALNKKDLLILLKLINKKTEIKIS
jgi:L,D-peptidoglycan transpeptidase YkuD (ErfK/YbiS/YcfS/YnhG family)